MADAITTPAAAAADWRDELRRQAELLGLRQAAKEIGFSPTTVAQVLAGRYTGDSNGVRRAVEGLFLGVMIPCPALGFEIRGDQCRSFQVMTPERAAVSGNLQINRTCSSCPHRRSAGKAPAEGGTRDGR